MSPAPRRTEPIPLGDDVFDRGHALAVGYEGHDDEWVRLYFEESVSIHVATPESAAALPAEESA